MDVQLAIGAQGRTAGGGGEMQSQALLRAGRGRRIVLHVDGERLSVI